MYEFFRNKLKIVGIDENGYGPLLGPLIITGIKIEMEGEDPLIETDVVQYRTPFRLKDSKYIFTRSSHSYKRGEQIVFEVFNLLGIKTKTFQELLNLISINPITIGEYGLEDFGLEDLMKRIFDATGMMVFFTAGEKEVHAWEVRKGATALDAAAAIHSDLARGFIRAEVFSFEDINREGSEKALKEKGLIHVVGKDHVINDGDIVFIRFNV